MEGMTQSVSHSKGTGHIWERASSQGPSVAIALLAFLMPSGVFWFFPKAEKLSSTLLEYMVLRAQKAPIFCLKGVLIGQTPASVIR